MSYHHRTGAGLASSLVALESSCVHCSPVGSICNWREERPWTAVPCMQKRRTTDDSAPPSLGTVKARRALLPTQTTTRA